MLFRDILLLPFQQVGSRATQICNLCLSVHHSRRYLLELSSLYVIVIEGNMC
jgi:hypothetical protein